MVEFSEYQFEIASNFCASLLVFGLLLWLWYDVIANNFTYCVRGVEVKIIENSKDCERCINQLLSRKPQVVGLDCEWKPIINKEDKHSVSLLQINDNNVCLLLQMQKICNINSSYKIPLNLIGLLG